MIKQRGSGTSEAMLIIGMLVYFMFMGYMGNASGYTANLIGNLSDWTVPYVSIGGSWWEAFFAGTIDFFIAVFNILAWVLGSLVSYATLIGYGLGGNLPAWISAFLFTPVAFGMGWLVLSLVRGRE